MGFFHPGVPPYMLQWGARNLPADSVAIETGTYRGDSAQMLHQAFGRCTTIEKSEELAHEASKRFADNAEILVLQGSSRERLGEALEQAGPAPFVWLDAHWSGGLTAGSDDPCPVLAEVEAIKRWSAGKAVVLIDDARIFGASDPDDQINAQWPSMYEVLRALEDGGWRTFVMDDVIAGIPASLATSFAKLTPQATTTRLGTLKATPARLMARRVTGRLGSGVAGLARRLDVRDSSRKLG